MKLNFSAIILMIDILLVFSLVACHFEESATPSIKEMVETPPSARSTEAIESSTSKTIASVPTTFNAASDFEVRRSPEEIALYPFTEVELDTALESVQKYLDEIFKKTGVLTYEVERIAYDPIMTDVKVRQIIADAPVANWSENDYYAHLISFAITYSATFDHEKTFMQDVEHDIFSVTLCRDNAQSAWELKTSGVPVEDYSAFAMSAEALTNVADPHGRILAGYELSSGQYLFYVYDDTTGKIQIVQTAP